MDRIRRDEQSPQGLKPNCEPVFMSELKLRRSRESKNATSLKTGQCEIGKESQEIQERTAAEGKERQTQQGTMYRAP